MLVSQPMKLFLKNKNKMTIIFEDRIKIIESIKYVDKAVPQTILYRENYISI